MEVKVICGGIKMKRREISSSGNIGNDGKLRMYFGELNQFFAMHKGSRIIARFTVASPGSSEALKGYYFNYVVPTFRSGIWEAGERLTEEQTERRLRELSPVMYEQTPVVEEEKKDYEGKIASAEKWLTDYEALNPNNFDTEKQLKEAEEHNKKAAKVADYLTKKKQADDKRAEAEKMDSDIAKLSAEREKLISSAKLPISGLSFSDDGLVLNDVPFVAGKVSDSQIMEVAAKLIIASNPTVKVFRIARGESLGQKRLQAILDLAKKEGFQGFIESVVRGQQDLIIEEYTENE